MFYLHFFLFNVFRFKFVVFRLLRFRKVFAERRREIVDKIIKRDKLFFRYSDWHGSNFPLRHMNVWISLPSLPHKLMESDLMNETQVVLALKKTTGKTVSAEDFLLQPGSASQRLCTVNKMLLKCCFWKELFLVICILPSVLLNTSIQRDQIEEVLEIKWV